MQSIKNSLLALAPVCALLLATPLVASAFTLGERPFAANSSWNTAIASNATYGNLNWPASNGYNYGINWEQYSPAIFFSSHSDPLVDVTYPPTWGWPGGHLYIRMPAAADGAAGTDGEVIIIDGSTVHSFWQFNRTSNTTATAQAYGATNIETGTGWGTKSPFLAAETNAAGTSMIAGMLVQAETDAGEINHALQLSVEFSLAKPNPVGEAISSDGSSSSGIVQEGQRLAIPKTTAMPSGLSPLGQKVFRALQNYGMFVIDVSG